MAASPTQDQVASLRDALYVVNQKSDEYSPSGLALEVARAIDAAHPECLGVFGHLAEKLICYERVKPSILAVLDDLAHECIAKAAD